MRALILGAGGQLGSELGRIAPQSASVRALNRRELDVTNAAAVAAEIAAFAPDVVINAAAYTAVDRAEKDEPEEARRVNAHGAECVARAVEQVPGCRLMHVSTDYVFSGMAWRPLRPDDATEPVNVYGLTKLEGERLVTSMLGARASIVRASWLYGTSPRGFLLSMLRLMRERGEVRVVADQIASPTSTISLAECLWTLASKDVSGIYHHADSGVASRYDFSMAISEEAQALELLPRGVRVVPVATADYVTVAARPAFSALDSSATAELLGGPALHWRVRLRQTLRGLRSLEPARSKSRSTGRRSSGGRAAPD